MVLQLGEVEGAPGQGFALRLVQLAGDADEPVGGRGEEDRCDGGRSNQAGRKRLL